MQITIACESATKLAGARLWREASLAGGGGVNYSLNAGARFDGPLRAKIPGRDFNVDLDLKESVHGWSIRG